MSKFYGVAHGFKRGVYSDWDEAKKQIDDFPQAVYKKFETEEEAEKFVEERKPKKIELSFPEPKLEKYYAVARGHVVGVFTDYSEVAKHIADYPQPLQKKFTDLDKAIEYFHKFYDGKTTGEPEVKKEKASKNEKSAEKVVAYYAVARGHNTGVFSTWDECKKQTDGFKGAKFKKFDNEDDAKLFSQGKTLKQIEEAKTSGSKRRSDHGEEEVETKKPKKK